MAIIKDGARCIVGYIFCVSIMAVILSHGEIRAQQVSEATSSEIIASVEWPYRTVSKTRGVVYLLSKMGFEDVRSFREKYGFGRSNLIDKRLKGEVIKMSGGFSLSSDQIQPSLKVLFRPKISKEKYIVNVGLKNTGESTIILKKSVLLNSHDKIETHPAGLFVFGDVTIQNEEKYVHSAKESIFVSLNDSELILKPGEEVSKEIVLNEYEDGLTRIDYAAIGYVEMNGNEVVRKSKDYILENWKIEGKKEFLERLIRERDEVKND